MLNFATPRIIQGGFLSIMFRAEKDSLGYNLMIIGSVEKYDLQTLRELQNEVEITFKIP